MRKSFIPALFVLLAAVAPAAPVHAGDAGLAGSKWLVKVTPDAGAAAKGEKAFDDVLIFEAGQVTMSECVKIGFQPGPYAVRRSGDGFRFAAVQVSPAQGKSSWKGETSGDTIKGTLAWTKKDGTVASFSFEGKRG